MIEDASISATNNQRFSLDSIPLLKLALKKWWLFGIVGLLAGVAGFFYAMSVKPEYESRLTFSLDAGANDGSLSGAMNLAAQFGFGFGGGQSMFDGDNILEIMKSMVESVLLSTDTFDGKPTTLISFYLDKANLTKAYSKIPRLQQVKFPPGVTKKSLSYLQDSILYNVYLGFQKQFIAASRPDKKLSIYEVRILSMDEKFSKVFTDRLVEATSNFYTEITSKKDRETLEILEQRVSSLKTNVGSSIDTKASSQDANVNPAFASAQSAILKQQYNMQAYGEAYKEMFKTLEMARYQYLKKIPLLQIIDHADYPMKKIKPGKAKTALLFAVVSSLLLMVLLGMWQLWQAGKNR
jgi:hypothetical protein